MTCPFCLADNGCALDDNKVCWCFQLVVPDDMLALIPSRQKDLVCVCRQCIDFYRADKRGFLEAFEFD
ncbi:cysteine-rich CWC family protein [Marinomonas sp. RSW2]|uniref:Cysteine-rich CWC family protein n=1 Tax=Marinomonas maritima TaxID=2940935 RepID=A0ABT5WC89_9GAMM|nr:cysteine-rich CWC family protein [Marinomonas maritima]MDE8602443.1 cysteine-rich CWC family protein [Marinomonas maritima]